MKANINDALRIIRKGKNYSLKQLSDELKVNSSYLSRIENGHLKPNLDIINKYATVFEVDLSTIILFAEELHRKPNLKENLALGLMNLMLIIEKCSDHFNTDKKANYMNK